MYINVVYSDKIPFWHVKRKSKQFFSTTEYIERNYVFTHPKQDSVFFLQKNTLHIRIPSDDSFMDLADKYLKSVFGDSSIGVSVSYSTGHPKC